MGLSNVERYRALNSKKEKRDTSLSSNVQRYKEYGLQKDLENANKAISETYSGWQNADTMASNKTVLTNAQKNLSDYYNLNQKNFTPEQREAYNSALGNYDSALKSWDETAEMYSHYVNAEGFDKAKKTYELGQKYKGASYEDIQKALKSATDTDEISFLRNYTDYSTLEDFDKAIAEREASRQRTQEGRKGRVVDVNAEKLKSSKDIYEKTHAFDEYRYLQNQSDYDRLSKDSEALRIYETGTATDPIRSMARGNVAYSESLSDEQRDMATYIYNTQGEEAYLDYMKKMTYVARSNEAAEMQREASDFAKEHPVAASFMYPTFDTLMGGISGIESLVSIANGETAPTTMQNLVSSNSKTLGEMSEGIKENYGKPLGFAYDVFTTAIPNRLGQMLFGSGYNVVMGLQSFSDTYADEVNNGTPAGTALLNALVTGGIETLTEQIGMEWAFGESKGAIMTVLKQAFAEGSEEVVGSLANLIYDINVNGGEAEYYQNVNKYIEMGYDTKEARHMASVDFAKEVAHQFGVAAFSTVPTTGVQQISRVRNESRMGEFIDREKLKEIGSEELSKKYGEEWSQKASNREVYNAYDKYVTETKTKATESEKADSVKALMSEYNLSEEEATKYVEALYDGKNTKILNTHFGSVIKEEADNGTGWAAKGDFSESSKYVDALAKSADMIMSGDQVKANKVQKNLKVAEKNTVNGEEAEIISMKATKDGYTVKTSKGEVDSKDVTVTADKAKALSYSAEITNEALKEAYVHYYAGEDIYDYDQYVRTAYEAGVESLDLSEFPTIIDGLGKAKAMAFYNLGAEKTLREEIATEEALDKVIKNYKSKFSTGKFTSGAFVNGKFKEDKDIFRNLNRTQKKLYKVVEAFSNLSGINVRVFVDRSAASKNGEFVADSKGGWISINLAARPYGDSAYGINKYVVSTLSHELTHWMKANNREAYDILENAIVESLTEKGTLEKHIKTEQDSYKKVEGKELSREVALEEVVARACEDMLNSTETMSEVLSHTDMKGLERLKAALEEWFKHIKEFFNELMSGFTSPNEITQSLSEEYEEIRKLWVKGINDAINMKRSGQQTSQKAKSAKKNSIKLTEREVKALDTLNVEIEGSYAYPKFNLKTFRESDYNKNIDIAAAALAKTMEISVEEAKKYIKDVGSIANIIARDQDRLDYEAIEGKSAWVSNPEYGGSLDYSFLCPKRLTYTGTMNAILKKQNDLIFSVDDFLWLRKALITAGYEAPCSFCFVESARARFGKYNQQFLDIAKAEKLAYIPTAEELTNPDKLEELRENHWETYSRYEKFLNGLSQRKPKMLEERRAYNGDILKAFQGKEDTIKDKNMHGGIRFNSFSDFEIVHMLDCMQAIMDMSRVGLAGFGYTKQKAFAQIFGKTGLKINMSCVAKGIEADGKHIIFDDVEGMNHEDAFKLRSGNVGIVCVVFNDAQLKAALCDERIDYVLPFHRSQWSKKDYEKMGLSLDTKDYTRPQTEKLGTKKAKEGNIPFLSYWNENQTGVETVQRYLDLINEQGKTPIFPMVLEKVDGKWTMPKGIKKNGKFINKTEEIKEKAAENYWKLLTEFKLYDNDGTPIGQSAVKPNFDMKAARALLKSYEGSHKEFPVAQNVVDDFLEYKKTGETKNFEWKRSSNKIENNWGKTILDENHNIISGEEVKAENLRAVFNELNTDKDLKKLGKKVFDAFDTLQEWRDRSDWWPKAYPIYMFNKETYSKKIWDGSIGQFSPSVNKFSVFGISYNADELNKMSDNDKARVILHEVIHAVTVHAIQNAENYEKSLGDKIYFEPGKAFEGVDSDVIKGGLALLEIHATIKQDVGDKYYGTSSPYEFVAELSNPEFRDYLKKKSLWGRIIDAIKQIFGIKDNAYDASVQALDMILSEYNTKQTRNSNKMEQTISSENTSLNQTPATFTNYEFKSTDRILDWGGGRYDTSKRALEATYPGIKVEVVDPFNRTKSHNDRVLKEYSNNKANVLTINNVLNVINSTSAIEDVIKESKKYLADDGIAYFLIFERDGSGIGEETSAGYQNNQKTSYYVPFVEKYYKNVEKKGSFILASDGQIRTTKMSASTKEKLAENTKEFKKQNLYMKDSLYSTKMDSKGNALTENQAEYFKDSKIRDSKGNLLLVRHGTDNKFTVFNPKELGGQHGNAEGYGIYFSDDTEVTSKYGDIQLEGYLNITKPAYSDKRTITETQLVRFIRATINYEVDKWGSSPEDTWISNYANTYQMSLNDAMFKVAKDILRMNSNDKDIIQEIMIGMGIRSYKEAYEFYDVLTNTLGFDGIVVKWKHSDGESNVFVAFNSNQFKNADNLNPTNSEDIRHSNKMDSEGKALTEDQVRFFKDSKARDESGNLLALYHGTTEPGFTTFKEDAPIYFATHRYVARSFAWDGIVFDTKTGKGSVYKCYVNVVNPLIVDAERTVLSGKMDVDIIYDENAGRYDIEFKDREGKTRKYTTYRLEEAFDDKTKAQIENYYSTHKNPKYKIKGKDINIKKPSPFWDIQYNGKSMSSDAIAKIAKEQGHDGVIIKNVVEGTSGFQEGTTDVIVFSAEQIKDVNNEHPTKDKDIRYSNKVDSQGSSLTEEQVKYFEKSKVRDKDGKLLVMYHGTQNEFNTFKPNEFIKEINGASKIVGYFSEDKKYAEIYGDVSEYYLNIENPLVMSGEAMTVEEWKNFFEKNGVKNVIFDSSITGAKGQIDTIKGGTYDGKRYYIFFELFDMANYWYGDGNLTEMIQKAGYDGIQSNDEDEKAWMPFNANAVKRIDNLNPTSNKDIRKSEKMSYDELSEPAKERIRELEEEVGRLSDENAALRAEKNMEKINAEKKVMVDRITEQAKVLSRWLLTNDKQNPVPQSVRIPLGKFLTSIDFTKDSYEWRKSHGILTKSDETLGTRMSKISQMLLELDQDKSTDKDAYDMSQLDWIPEFSTEFAKIKDTIAEVESKEGERFHLGKMNHDDLQTLLNLITALKTSIINMNKCLSAHNKMTIEGVGKEVISYLDRIGQKDKDGFIKQFLEISNTTPYYFFQRLGRGGEHTFRLLMDGMSKYAFEAKQIEDFAKETFKGEDVKKWRDEVKTFEVEEYEVKTDKKEGEMPLERKSRTIQMTVPQIMSLYCLQKRDQAMNHIKSGGIRVGTFETREDGKRVKVRQIENVTLTEKDLKSILSTLTNEQKDVADELQKFMNTVCQKWGNEVTMKRFGYKGMTEKDYFPINVDRNQLSSEARQKGSSLYQMLNMGFTKPINPNAKNPIEIFDIFETFTIHATEMAQYNSLALPVLDVIKIWNYRDQELLDEEENKAHWHSVKGSIESALGEKANGYIGRLLADLNGDVTGGRADKFGKKLVKNYKTAAVAANLQVAMLQPLSYIRAGYMVDNKYLTKALAMKSDREKCLQYCGIAQWKEMGFYNTAINTGLEHKIMQDDSKKDKLIEKTLFLAGKMDEWTWGKLWNACLLETQDNYPTLEGEDLYKKTGERLTEVIYGTQVVDSILTRSDLMRGADMYTNMITAFQSEPTLSLNILMDAAVRFNQEKRANGKQAALKEHGEKIKRAALVYLTSSAVESLLRAVIGKIRNYDGDEDDETLIEDFFKRFIEELNPLRKIPLVKDFVDILVSAVSKGRIYTDARLDEAIFENIGKSYLRIKKLLSGGEVNYRAINEIAKGFDASGLPVSSSLRVLKVLWNNTIGRIWESLNIK